MNNQIYDIKENFDFNILNLENPSLINGNNYYSKIYNTNINKNLYIQLPKCKTKQGIINSNTKCFCDLEFNSNDKLVIEFFENLENYCMNQICNNKELWFYDSNNISNEDIQEYITPIMRSYKSGKKFLIKSNIKKDKLRIYDENEKNINLEDLDLTNEIIPLICINGIKFTRSSFIIDIILVQFMVLYPSDNFENQLLIKLNNNKKYNNDLEDKTNNDLEDKTNNDLEDKTNNDLEDKTNNDLEDKYNQDLEDRTNNLEDKSNQDLEDKSNQDLEDKSNQDLEDKNNNDLEDKNNNDLEDKNNNDLEDKNNNDLEDKNNNDLEEKFKIEEIQEKKEDNNFKYLINNFDDNNQEPIELTNLDIIEENLEPIELKTHETIYLEIYKKAKQKAKEIRKNAIEAFLEAKNIKIKYNLNDIVHDSSSDEENELLNK